MSTAELKVELIARITELEDTIIMEQIKQLLDIEENPNNDSLIPDWFIPELLERKRAYEHGETQVLSWEERH